MAIPIPSPAEQHRIVSRVAELMEVCDELERSLTAMQMGRAQLLGAVLHEVLAEDGVGPERVLAGAY